MIYTRFGSPVKVLSGNIQEGGIVVERNSDNKIIVTTIGELKADNGIKEIYDAIDMAPGITLN